MKKYFLLIILVFMGCSSSKKIPKKETIKIDEAYQKVTFTPENISREIDTDFEIKVRPIDAKTMNKITFDASYFDGNYEKYQSISILIDEKLQENLPKEDRRRLELKKQIIDFIGNQVDRGEISSSTGESLIKKIWDKSEGIDGTEKSIGRGYPNLYNPFKVGKKYLSVFELTFKNTTDLVKEIELKDILFNSEYEQLYPFDNSYFEKLYEQEQEKLRIIYRLNMPNKLVIPPGETVIKYVSIPSLNPTFKDLDVKLLQKKTQNMKFTVNIEAQSETTILEKFTFKVKDEFKLQIQGYYLVIITSDGRTHTIKDNNLFLPQDIKQDKLSLYGVVTSSSGFTFIKKENFTLGQYQYNVVELILEKEQRYTK